MMTEAVANKDVEVKRTEELPVCVPPADVYETPEKYVILMDLPGVSKSDLEVNVEEGVLTVSAVRSMDTGSAGRVLLEEWEPCRYERSFNLASDCDTEKIEATLRQGVLTVTIPKTEAARPKRIEVKAE